MSVKVSLHLNTSKRCCHTWKPQVIMTPYWSNANFVLGYSSESKAFYIDSLLILYRYLNSILVWNMPMPKIKLGLAHKTNFPLKLCLDNVHTFIVTLSTLRVYNKEEGVAESVSTHVEFSDDFLIWCLILSNFKGLYLSFSSS